MKTILVSFLGKGSADSKTGYRPATYQFDDHTTRQTPFFGLALAQQIKPDEIVILGTAGSMWDVLVEHLAGQQEFEEARLALMEAASLSEVTAAQLQPVKALVQQRLGCAVAFHLIPYGRTEQEQTDILQTIAAAVPKGNKIILDLTHGFRHSTSLGLLSAFFLERMAQLEIGGLYYGALDMTDRSTNITPVIRLDGLLTLQRWVDALSRFDHSGDYGLFAPLLVEAGIARDKAACLEKAAFCERTFNLADARSQLQTFLPILDQPFSGIAKLFQAQLLERLAWARKGTLPDWQTHLAYRYLKQQDYVRAVIFGWEALTSRECEPSQVFAYESRQLAAEKVEAKLQGQALASYKTLKHLRNSLAHGIPADNKKIRAIVADFGRLPTELQHILAQLLPK